jgi:hypothetical protein
LKTKLEIYEKRYFILYEKLKELELMQAKKSNTYRERLNYLTKILKKINIINQSLNRINHVDMNITFNFVVNNILENDLIFDNKDYNYLLYKLKAV